jgi:hypothetical protein
MCGKKLLKLVNSGLTGGSISGWGTTGLSNHAAITK